MAALLHPVLVIAASLLVAGATVDYFRDKPVTYSAGATLAVGRIDVPANAVPGYSAANNTLAGSYSRFVGTDQHLDKIATLAGGGVTRQQVRSWGKLSASNVPEAAIIRVHTVAPRYENALRLADLGAQALVELVAEVNDPSAEGQSLLERHAAASRSLADAVANVEKLQRDLAFFLQNNRADDAANTQEQLLLARADQQVQQLRVNTLATLYQESQRYLVDGPLVRLMNSATFTGSSRSANVELGVVAGAVGGMAAAIGLAWLVTNAKGLLALRRAAVYGQRSAVRTNGSTPYPAWPAAAAMSEQDSYKNAPAESLAPSIFRD
jgi:hypothetical protein